MLRVVAGLLRNIAYNLGIPTTLLHSLLMADASQEIGWLMDKLQRNSKAQSKPSRVMLSLGKTQGLKSMSKEEGWNYPVVKILHFKEKQHIRPNYRTAHEYSRGLFKLVASGHGSIPCGMQMLMPRPQGKICRKLLSIFKVAQENDITVFAGFALSKLCQAISVPVGVRPLYLAANIGCARPEAPLNSVLVQFDAHVSYLRLHHVIVKATSLSGMEWSQPLCKQHLFHNTEFFNKKNPFSAFWFGSSRRTAPQQQDQSMQIKWIILRSALGCLAIPLLVVNFLSFPVGVAIFVNQ